MPAIHAAAQGQPAGGDRAIPLLGMFPVGFDIRNVVEDVDRGGYKAKQEEARQRPQE